MGVTLYYSGKLKSIDVLPDLKFEVQDIANTMHWKCREIDDSWVEPVDVSFDHSDGKPSFQGNAGLKGLILSPHEDSESIWLLFDKSGQLHTLFSKMLEHEGRSDKPFGSTKTQFAGVDTHIKVVKILKYLGAKYMSDFSLDDDSGYAKHGDRERAQEIFGTIEMAMNHLEDFFENVQVSDEAKEDPEVLFNEIEERISQYMGGNVSVHMVRLDEEE